MKTVLIYKTELLYPSETFISAQAGALSNFRAQFAGLQQARQSLSLPTSTIFAVQGTGSGARSRLYLYRLFNVPPPGFFERLQASQPSLIHSHFATESITALPIAERLRIPLVVTLHGADITVNESVLRKSLGGMLYLRRQEDLWRRASVFICVSEFVREKALERGFPEEKLRVHYIGINRKQFAPEGGERKPNSVLFVGRLVEKKGCRYLLEAMAIVQQKIPEAELTIIGDGPLRTDLEGLAGRLRVRCQFLGSQTTEVVRNWLARVRVFCAPSVTAQNGDSEGLGMVFAEAQAMGVPVVTSDHGGVREAVRNGHTGVLAPERDAAKLADGILTYLMDDESWRTASRLAIEWVGNRFDLEVQTRQLEEIYATALSSFSQG